MPQVRRPHSSQLMSGILHPQTNLNLPVPKITPATGFQFRELSRLQRNSSRPCSKPARKFRVSLNAKNPRGLVMSRKAPFAERTKTVSERGSNGKPGQRDFFPRYNSINDPHLFHYYARKFGFQSTPPFTHSERCLKYVLKGNQNNRSGNQPKKETKDIYKVTVKTGDKRNAGTLAKVFLMVNGSKAKIKKQRLCEVSVSDQSLQSTTFQFSPGSCHNFEINGPDIGDIKSIFLEHDGLLEKHAWFVEEVSISSVAKGKCWQFMCQKWLSLFHNDCQLGRTFYPASTSDLQLLSNTHTKNAGNYALFCVRREVHGNRACGGGIRFQELAIAMAEVKKQKYFEVKQQADGAHSKND